MINPEGTNIYTSVVSNKEDTGCNIKICEAVVLLGRILQTVGIYLLDAKYDIMSCLLLATRELLKTLLDNGCQLDIISKNEVFKHLVGQSNAGVPKNDTLPRIRYEMFNVWWHVKYIIRHHLHCNIAVWKPVQY